MKLTGLRLAALLVVLSGAVAALVIPSPLVAAGKNRAGVIVRHSDGTVRDMCVFFDEEEISGYELLERSGITFEAESYGTDHAICKIGSEGCSPSHGEDCLKCKEPNAWSYYLRNAGDSTWGYSSVGADRRNVHNGYLDGWSWGEGSQAPKPPAVPFSDVCPAAAATTTAPHDDSPSSRSTNAPRAPGSSQTQPDTSASDDGKDGAPNESPSAEVSVDLKSSSPDPEDDNSRGDSDGKDQALAGDDESGPRDYLTFVAFALIFAVAAAALYFMRRRRARSDT